MAPAWILLGESQDQIHDNLADARPAYRLPLLGVIFFGHEFSVPAEDRVRCHNGRQLLQCFASDRLSLDRQEEALVIGEQDAFLTELLQQSGNLGVLKVNDLCLTLVHQAAKGNKQDLPGLEKESHWRASWRRKPEFSLPCCCPAHRSTGFEPVARPLMHAVSVCPIWSNKADDDVGGYRRPETLHHSRQGQQLKVGPVFSPHAYGLTPRPSRRL